MFSEKSRCSYGLVLLLLPAAILAWAGSVSAGQPDLEVSFTADPSPAVGSTVRVLVNVWNSADGGTSDEFTIGLYIRSDPPMVGDPPDQSYPIAGILGGMGGIWLYQFPFTFTCSSQERWQLYAMVDCYDDIAESDETDNIVGPVTMQWTEGSPDFVILDVTPSETTPVPGTNISIDVTVKNQGTRGAAWFGVSMFPEDPSPLLQDGVYLGGRTDYKYAPLPAGQEATLTFSIYSSSPDVWNVYMIVNNLKDIGEVDTSNNIFGPVPISWLVPGIDLLVTGIEPSKEGPTTNDTISVDVHVLNGGTLDAGAFSVELFYDETTYPAVGTTGDASQPAGPLASGTETIVTFTGINASAAEMWSMYAIVDNGEAVTEANENNNVKGGEWVTWRDPAPDLVVTAITPSDSSPSATESISVDVTVENQGDIEAVSFSLDLYYNKVFAPMVGDAADQAKTVNSLAAGAQTTVTFTGISSSAEGTWNMYAAVDGGYSVAELDETNNLSGPVTVAWSEPESDVPGCGAGTAGARGLTWLLPLGLAGAAVLFRRGRARQV